jgi:virginiamycin B lyase
MTLRATIGAALALLALPGVATAAAPTISNSAISVPTTESATLEADLNPEGKALHYRFEYGLGDCESNPCTSTPVPDAKLPSGTAPVRVSAEVEGLSPGTTYHFRLVAENSAKETSEGADTLFATYALDPVFASCANDLFRGEAEPSSLLPDCRAYEQASPSDKNGADVNGGPNEVQASGNGDAVAFFSAAGLPGGVGAQEFETYLARRGEGDWSIQGVYPPASAGVVASNAGWTPDLSYFFSRAAPSLVEPRTFRLRDSADGSFDPMPVSPSGLLADPYLAGASTDGSKVYLQTKEQLDPAAKPGTDNLYLWDRESDTVELAGVLPDSECGSPPCVPAKGSFAGSHTWFAGTKAGLCEGGIRNRYYVQDQHAISSDGSRAYFTTACSDQLYLREGAGGPSPRTVHVSASQRTPADPLGSRPAVFMGATPDGSKAFFTSAEELTDDANTGPVQEPPTIARADLGGDPESVDLNFLPAHGQGLAIHAGYVYWADADGNAIGRAKLDGSEAPEDEFISGADNPHYVAVDDEHVYWTNAADEEPGTGTIGRAELGATEAEGVEQDFIVGATNPQGIAVDAGHVYWANNNLAADEMTATDPGGGSIGRAELPGGTGVEQGFIPVAGESAEFTPEGIAVNAIHIYMTIDGTQEVSYILRYDIDGNPDSRIIRPDVDHENVINSARGLALDGGHVYWARQGFETIGRADLALEGASVEREFIDGAENPLGVAVDGEHVYWSTNQEAIPNPGNDLYRWDAGSEELTDLAPEPEEENGAEVVGVLGVSADGSSAYFAANGDLDDIGPAEAGNCRGTGGLDFLDFSGKCGLYLAREGQDPIFIARLDAGGDGNVSDAADWEPKGTKLAAPEATARVSADGETLVFRSQEKLTPYDNEGTPELYRFHLGEGLRCLSCNPTGTAPRGTPSLQSIDPFLISVEPPGNPAILTRNLSADGNRFFFETPERLVAADTDGEGGCPSGGQAEVPVCQDVYEWEAAGTGSCQSALQNGGCLYLLSDGKVAVPSFFADASTSGDDAFIFTREALVPQDRDRIQDVYDLRVGGGLASQHVVPPTPCEAEAPCRPAVSPTHEEPGPSTAEFKGPPDPVARKPKPRCRRAKTRRHGRCVAKRRHRDQRRDHKGAEKGKGNRR